MSRYQEPTQEERWQEDNRWAVYPIEKIEAAMARLSEAVWVKDSDAYVPLSADAIEAAQDRGLSTIFPKENELLLDFDNSLDYDYFQETGRGILSQFWGIKKVEEKPSTSNKLGHVHVRVTLRKKIEPMERFALQAALGSDRKRELLGIAMLNNEDPHPTFLIQREGRLWKQA